jgi:predicted oxidoreductase
MKIQTNIVAGTIRWGAWGAKLSTQKMADLILACFEAGIYAFDLSDVYGNYSTEREFGKAFSLTGIPRKEVRIITKCGIIKPCAERPGYSISHFDTSEAYILASMVRSLNNLEMDYVDDFLIARPHPGIDFTQIGNAFDAIRAHKKSNRLGVVSFKGSQIRALASKTEIDIAQLEVSITHLEPLLDGTMDTCQEYGIEVMSWSPIGGGAIFTNNKNGKNLELRLAKIADKYNWSLTEMALHFLSMLPGNVTPIINQYKIDKFIEAKEIQNNSITNEQWFEILYASLGHELT